jgi:choline dehydrogenase
LGNVGWAWDDVQEYFERVSCWLPSWVEQPKSACLVLPFGDSQTFRLVPPNGTDHYRTYDSSLYSSAVGPGTVGYTNFNPPSIDGFVESLPSIGIPIAYELNSGNNIGGKHELNTLNPLTQTRVSSYIAFWNSTVVRPNFEAIMFAVVEKILFENATDGSAGPVAYGVEYSASVNGTKMVTTAYANREVILSAGTLSSPQILMLSVSWLDS